MESMSLTTATLLYNFILATFCGLAVFRFAYVPLEERSAFRYLFGLVGLGCASVGVSVLLSMPRFNPLLAARLLCFGWFAFLPLYSLACAWLTRHSTVRAIAGTLVVATTAIVLFAFRIEPFRLEVTNFEITSSKVDRTIKICVLADFQTDKFETYEQQSLIRLLDEKPDLILMAGDYLQADTQQDWQELRDQMSAFLGKHGFQAPLGIYGVGGNTDFQRWPEIFDGLDVVLFENTRSVDNGQLRVTGLSIEDSFDPNVSICGESKGAIETADDNRRDEHLSNDSLSEPFRIVLGHAPDFALSPSVDADLLVAGHTHGGQVRLPLIGPLVTFSRVPRSWAAGMTKLDDEKWLVVSRGVGMERRDAPRLRFLCRPQIAVITVSPSANATSRSLVAQHDERK